MADLTKVVVPAPPQGGTRPYSPAYSTLPELLELMKQQAASNNHGLFKTLFNELSTIVTTNNL